MAPDAPDPSRRMTTVALDYESRCSSCGATDVFVLQSRRAWRCLVCAGFPHLEFLPSGNAALSRRAAKASPMAVDVMRVNARRQRYERRGLLVTPVSIERAARQCLCDVRPAPRRMSIRREVLAADDERFQAKLAAAIIDQYPGCPTDRAEAIALHRAACSSGDSGRVVDDDAVRAAVTASIRHVDTDYGALLASGVTVDDALARVRHRVENVVTAWRDGATMLDG